MDIFKFYVKLAVTWIRALLFLVVPVESNKEGWAERVLLINLELIGDMVMFTGVLKHYRAAMPGKKIFLLISSSSGLSHVLVQGHVDEVLTIDVKALKSNPFYGYSAVRKLRRIGFETVVEHNPAMQFIEKIIALELGAKETISYKGIALDDDVPPNINSKFETRYFHRVLEKRFTRIAPRITERISPLYLTHMIAHHAAIFESVTGVKPGNDLSPEIFLHKSSDEKVKNILSRNGIKPFSYALFSLGASSLRKEWPPEKFAELGKVAARKGIPIILTGNKKDISKSKLFIKLVGASCVDLTGETTISDAVSLVRYSLITVSNDTALTHFAVAFKRPSLSIMYPTRPGWAGPYGYRDINRWVIREDVPCFGDNGQCGNFGGPNTLTPCMAAVTVGDAMKEFLPLLDRITLPGASYPQVHFELFAK